MIEESTLQLSPLFSDWCSWGNQLVRMERGGGEGRLGGRGCDRGNRRNVDFENTWNFSSSTGSCCLVVESGGRLRLGEKSEWYVERVRESGGNMTQEVWLSELCWFIILLTGLFPRPCVLYKSKYYHYYIICVVSFQPGQSTRRSFGMHVDCRAVRSDFPSLPAARDRSRIMIDITIFLCLFVLPGLLAEVEEPSLD